MIKLLKLFRLLDRIKTDLTSTMFFMKPWSHKRSIVMFFGLCFVLSSCEFIPTKEYYLDLENPTMPPDISIDLHLNDENEKVIFYNDHPNYIRLNLQHDKNIKIYQVEFFLDNNKITPYTLTNNPGYFADIGIYDTLDHVFRVEYVCSSGSGSLADYIGYEGFAITSKEWILTSSKIDYYSGRYELCEEGALIKWEEYDGANFKAYKIKVNLTNSDYVTYDNEYMDSDYFGGQGYYKIYVIDNLDQEFLWSRVEIPSMLPELKLKEIDRQLVLTWEKTGIEQWIKGWEISYGANMGYWDSVVTVNTDINNLIINNYIFGERRCFAIMPIPRKNVDVQNTYLCVNNDFLRLALPGPSFGDNYGTTSKGALLQGNGSMYFYSSIDQSVTSAPLITPPLIQSPDGNYLIKINFTSVNIYDYGDLTLNKSINIKDSIDDFDCYSTFRLSDNGILSFFAGNYLYMYDLEEEKVLIKKEYSHPYNIVTSPYARFVLLYAADSLIISEYDGNSSLKEINHLKKSAGFYYPEDFKLIPNDSNNFYCVKGANIIIKDIITQSVVRTFPLNGSIFFNIDFANDKVLSYDDGYYYIQKFSTGQLLQAIPTSMRGSSHYVLLCDNTIFYTSYKCYINK